MVGVDPLIFLACPFRGSDLECAVVPAILDRFHYCLSRQDSRVDMKAEHKMGDMMGYYPCDYRWVQLAESMVAYRRVE